MRIPLRILSLSVVLGLAVSLMLGLPTLTATAQDDATFETDSVITREISDSIDRSTPRASVEGFIDSARQGDFARASVYLDLSDIPSDETAWTGQLRARQLHEVIKAKVWINWASLPDREDGLDSMASTDEPMSGEPRRSLLLGIVDLDGRPVEVRINRYEPTTGDPVWLFSGRTQRYLPALYDAYGPGSIEQMLPDTLRQEAFWRIPIWQLIALPLILLISALVGYIAYRMVRGLERRLAPRDDDNEPQKRRWLAEIVNRAAAPIALLMSAALILVLNANLLSFSGPANVVISIGTSVALVAAVALVVLRIIGTILDIVTDRYVSSIDDETNSRSRHLITNISVARRIVIILALIGAAAAVFAQLNLSQSLGISLLASAGVISLILGFAAQTVLGNVLASIQIAIAKPIRIGDAVQFDGEWGYIEEINFTYVLIQTWDGRRFIVPVRYFVSEPFENWSIRNAAMLNPVEIQLDPLADIDVLRAHFKEILESEDDWDKQQEPKVLVVGNNGWSITVRFYASAANPSAAWNLQCRLREKLYAVLRDECDGAWLPRERHQPVESSGAGTGARQTS